MREGVYAINIALFIVMTEDTVYRLEAGGSKELKALVNWQNELSQIEGFNPVIIGGAVEAADPLDPEKTLVVDSIGIVTIHDGPSLPPARSSPPPWASTATTRTSTTTSRIPRRSSRPAAAAACSMSR